MKKMVLVEVTKAHELQAERPSAERPTKGDLKLVHVLRDFRPWT